MPRFEAEQDSLEEGRVLGPLNFVARNDVLSELGDDRLGGVVERTWFGLSELIPSTLRHSEAEVPTVRITHRSFQDDASVAPGHDEADRGDVQQDADRGRQRQGCHDAIPGEPGLKALQSFDDRMRVFLLCFQRSCSSS